MIVQLVDKWIPKIVIGERYPIINKIFGDTLYIKFFYSLLVTLRFVVGFNRYLLPLIGASVIYGMLIVVYDFFTTRNIVKNKYFIVLFCFWLSLAISVIANFDYGFMSNSIELGFVFYELFVFSMIPFNKTKEQYLKEIKAVNTVMISSISIICILSFITFAFDISGRYEFLGTSHLIGYVAPRLRGIAINSISMSWLSYIGVCLIVFQISVFQVSRWPYITMLIICLSTGLLANARGANLSFYVFIFVHAFLFYLLRKNNVGKLIKARIISSVFMAFVILFSVFGFFDRLLPTLGYLPAVVQYVQDIIRREPVEFEPTTTVRISELVDTGEFTGSGRLHIWQIGLEVFMDYPLWGTGFARLELYSRPYVWWSYLPYLHNVYIQILVTFGLFAFVMFSVVLIYLFWEAVRKLNELISENLYSPFFVISVSMIAYFLAQGLTEGGILVYSRHASSFLFAHFCGILFTCIQTDILK